MAKKAKKEIAAAVPLKMLQAWSDTRKYKNAGLIDCEDCDLDDLMDYVAGGQFMKQSYAGKFANENQNILKQKDFGKMMLYGSKNADIPYQQFRTDMSDLIVMPTMIRLWAKYRQVYVFDPDFADALTHTEEIRIPLEIFSQLPYKTFFFSMEGLPFAGPFCGCLLHVGIDPASGIPYLVVLRVQDNPQGEPVMYSMYMHPKDTLKRCVEEDGKRYMYISSTTVPQKVEHIRCPLDDILQNKAVGKNEITVDQHREMFLFLMQAILYLASDKPDMEYEPQPQITHATTAGSTYKNRKAQQQTPSIIRIGKRYGEKYRATMENNKKDGKRDVRGSAGPRRAHVRAAHWHHYWTGKGRTVLILRWIEPVFVSGAASQEIDTVVHRVGENRRELRREMEEKQ